MNKQRSKGFTLVEILIVVVIIGLRAAMAIPTFERVRANSREKTVLNNLRQVASGGNQYLLQYGATSVDYAVLAGDYFPVIQTVAGETYSGLTVNAGGGVLTVSSAALGTVAYSY